MDMRNYLEKETFDQPPLKQLTVVLGTDSFHRYPLWSHLLFLLNVSYRDDHSRPQERFMFRLVHIMLG